ncbi:hypothetical protein EASAB2608_01106 [Streptomyces sp. EAS-AB2608]|uniref:hypothetical protein n=1 Tax=Streptomyces sp. EAS-AB2608 TaxID=2779671 RepID=UPI001BF03541|nr:hypothetical protein [Streptomyces sp. EAS-AB2608]BCM65772.1 hypothetical protein EASAB2608_01106 [Streptomyces sp. EAS-AB2608]
MSDPQTDSHSPAPVPADGSDTVRAEVQREYAAKLAHAELRAQAAQSGIKLGDGFTDYLDASKLLGEDGTPSAEAIGKALAPFAAAQQPQFPHLVGAGFHRDGDRVPARRVSLDIRKR